MVNDVGGHTARTLSACCEMLSVSMNMCTKLGLLPMDVNALALGMVLKSMTEEVGDEKTVEFLIEAWARYPGDIKLTVKEKPDGS